MPEQPTSTLTPVLMGLECPYCGKASVFADSKEVYGRSYGMMYICRPCDAYVGVHKGTREALGRLAKAPLRDLKKQVHAAFDPLWKTGRVKRNTAYKLLADHMMIPVELCHVGMMDEEQCKSALAGIAILRKTHSI